MVTIGYDLAYRFKSHPHPPGRRRKWSLALTDRFRDQWLKAVFCSIACNFNCRAFKQFFSGLFCFRLRDQSSADGDIKDALFKSVNRLGPVEQEVEVLGDALPVVGQRLRRLAGGQSIEQRGREPPMLLVSEAPALLQRVAEFHQFFDTGYDSVLFRKGW